MKTLSDAEQKYPMPKFTAWHLYRNRFKYYATFIGAGLVIVGAIFTGVGASKPVIGVITLLFSILIVTVTIMHSVAWISLRVTERKRAKYLGMSLREYKNNLIPLNHVDRF